MNYLSLNAWAIREGIPCSTSQKLYKEGKIIGAIEEQAGKLKRVKVPEDFHLEKTGNEVTCCVCGKEFPQITSTHLKMHQLTPAEYKEKYPDSPMIGNDVISAIKTKLTGIERSEEFKENVSKGRSGVASSGGSQPVHGVPCLLPQDTSLGKCHFLLFLLSVRVLSQLAV